MTTTQPDPTHPESEHGLEHLREENTRRQAMEPGMPPSRGNANHGVLRDDERTEPGDESRRDSVSRKAGGG